MAARKNKTPDFFKEEPLDPVEIATGPGRTGPDSEKTIDPDARKAVIQRAGRSRAPDKKKAGFYISVALLDRFSRRFYELKLAGVAVENKSALLEAALSFALDDLDKGQKSRLLLFIEAR